MMAEWREEGRWWWWWGEGVKKNWPKHFCPLVALVSNTCKLLQLCDCSRGADVCVACWRGGRLREGDGGGGFLLIAPPLLPEGCSFDHCLHLNFKEVEGGGKKD